jgi:hypothetical protein
MDSREFRSAFGLMVTGPSEEQWARLRAEMAPTLANPDAVRAAYDACHDLDEANELTDRLLWASRAKAPTWLDDPTGTLNVATLATGEVLSLSSAWNGDQIDRDVVLWRSPDEAAPELVWSAWAAYARSAP